MVVASSSMRQGLPDYGTGDLISDTRLAIKI